MRTEPPLSRLDDPRDVTISPRHYSKWPIQPLEFIMRNGMPFWMGNVIKYVARAGSKNYEGLCSVEAEIRDLEKAKSYIDARIAQLNGETSLTPKGSS